MKRSPRSCGSVVVACTVLVLLASGRPAAAQNTGTVSGTIIDSSGQVVPGATVTLTNESTADARMLVSNERGDFAFFAVPPGSYTVQVQLTGFKPIDRRNNVLNASGQLDLGRLQLDVGNISEVVIVASSGALVE